MTPTIALKEVDDDLQKWLRHIGFWNDEIAARVDRTVDRVRSEGKKILPMDIELELRAFIKGKINRFCLVVLNYARSDSRGVNIRNFDLGCLDLEDPDSRVEIKQQIDDALASGECACEALIAMGLARLDDEILKPLKAAFDPRIVDFISLRSVY